MLRTRSDPELQVHERIGDDAQFEIKLGLRVNPVSPGLVSSRIELLDQVYGSARCKLERMSSWTK